jgi:hypothetical protein
VALFLSDGIDDADDLPENDSYRVLSEANDALMSELIRHFPDYFYLTH